MAQEELHHDPPHDIPLRFQDYFVTGLAALLPVWLTLYIMWFLVQLMGNLLFPIVRPFLMDVLKSPPPEELLLALASMIVLFSIALLGFLIIRFAAHGHIERAEGLIARIPFVSGIHGVIKRLVEIFLGSKSKVQRIAQVEFPLPGQYALGFITRDEPIRPSDGGEALIPVVIPTAPNPTSGFLILVPESRVVYIDISVDEAMTILLSAGSFGPSELRLKRPVPRAKQN